MAYYGPPNQTPARCLWCFGVGDGRGSEERKHFRGRIIPPSDSAIPRTDPELKGGRSSRLQGVVFWAVTTKKEAGLCFSCHLRHDHRRKAGCLWSRRSRPGMRSSKNHVWRQRQKTSPDKKTGFFCRVGPNTTRSHRQTPPIAIARSFQLAENRRFAAGGSVLSPPPLF